MPIVGAQAAAPTLASVNTLTGATEDITFSIPFTTLSNATDVADADSNSISFRIQTVDSGSLTKGGSAVVAGTTLFGVGETLVWTPASNENGPAIDAFNIVAWDGTSNSTPNVQVSVDVAAEDDPPTLGSVSTLSGAFEDMAFPISFATLSNATDVAEVDMDAISFRIVSQTSGTTLTEGGTAVTNGTLFGPGETLMWTAPTNQNGSAQAAFTIVAWDGTTDSTPARQVSVNVTAVNDAPTLTNVNDLTGADEGMPFTITYADLAAAANEADIDGPTTFSFRVMSVTANGVLSKNSSPVNPGSTLLSTGETWEWEPAELANGLLLAFSIVAYDGTDESINPVTVSINVAPAPIPLSVVASATPSTIIAGTTETPFFLQIGDSSLNNSNYTVNVQTAAGGLSFSNGAVSMTGDITGTRAQVQAAIRGVQYTANSVVGTQMEAMRIRVVDAAGTVASDPVTLTIIGANNPPQISGTSPEFFTTDAPGAPPVLPFPSVVISDPDAGQELVVTLTSDNPTAGTLFPAGFTNTSQSALNLALNAVTFTPNRLTANTTVNLTITVSDGLSVRSNSATRINIGVVNDPPQILGVPVVSAQPLAVSPAPPVNPFRGLTIADDDTSNVTVVVTVADTTRGSFTNLTGFTLISSNQYRIIAPPATATAALQDLAFDANPTNSLGATTFTIKATDFRLAFSEEALDIELREELRNHLVILAGDLLDMNNNPMPGTLRAALKAANARDVITFALPSYDTPVRIRLNAALGPLVVDRAITIKGPGADLLTISGDSDGNQIPDMQLFQVTSSLTLEGVTLADGTAGTGGAMLVDVGGDVTLRDCAVVQCRAVQWGGAIDVFGGALQMERCLLLGNTTDATFGRGGGAVSIYTDQACSFINTTFSGNLQQGLTGSGGGGLFVENLTASSPLVVKVIHCTFSENVDASDTGSSIHAKISGARVEVKNSIFADGQGRNLEVNATGRIISKDGNVSDDEATSALGQGGTPGSTTFLDQGSDIVNVDPLLLPLDMNVRPTAGYPLQSASVARGNASSGTAIDQRGVVRDANRDSGALEFNTAEQIVLNEVHWNPDAGEVDFLEFYVTRESLVAVDLSGATLRVDGTNLHVFAASTFVQPGFGIIVADAIFPAAGSPVVVGSAGPLQLGERGILELVQPTSEVILSAEYAAAFVNPTDPNLPLAGVENDSVTLTPQFRGAAYLPHSIVPGASALDGADLNHGGATTSAGQDAAGVAFGAKNAAPVAKDEDVVISEDEIAIVDVLANDLDQDGSDVLLIVDVSATAGAGGNDASTTTGEDAAVSIDPPDTPLAGLSIIYNPRVSTNNLQTLPVGGEQTDVFYYSIIDQGTGNILEYQGTTGSSPVTVFAPSHRLVSTTAQQVVISGSDVAAYNGTNTITVVDDDFFSIPVVFAGNATTLGQWETIGARLPENKPEAQVTVTVLGANDVPVPGDDLIVTDEETIKRVLGDAALAVTGTVFATDGDYPDVPEVSTNSLLRNDMDPDTDDDASSLLVVGVVGAVNPIDGYSGTVDASPITVDAPGHGLSSGTEILISGYGGHPSYNGFHTVTVIDPDTFTLPIAFVDSNVVTGVWAILNDANRLSATSAEGASVTLEIRADRTRTGFVYNPRGSSSLNALALTESTNDFFYVAVEDRHGGTALGKMTVTVNGVNDEPVIDNNPSSLGALAGFTSSSQTLEEVVASLEVLYVIPSESGDPDRVDALTEFDNNGVPVEVLLVEIWNTSEDQKLDIASADLLANDTDPDTTDEPFVVVATNTVSRRGADITLSPDGLTVTYDSTFATNLQALAREESVIDTFEIVVNDDNGGLVTNLVAVRVLGANDAPIAVDDADTTPEDTPFVFEPALNDLDTDIDGHVPDDTVVAVDMTNQPTPGDAVYRVEQGDLTYDPSGSATLDALAVGQVFTDCFDYVIADRSFVFANDDSFLVQADGSGYELDLLANDRDLTGAGATLTLTGLGTPSEGGTVTTNATGTAVIYSPQISFVGDEFFIYSLTTAEGLTDRGRVTVRVTVDQLNGNLQANPDAFTVARGEASTLNVLGNDNRLPEPGEDLVITRILDPLTNDTVTVVGSQILFTQNATGPFPYTRTFSYEVSGGGTARAVAEVTVEVVDRIDTLTMGDDAFVLLSGSISNELDVLFNDAILPGAGSGLTITQIDVAANSGTAVVSSAGDRLVYTPNAGFVGTDTVTYRAADGNGGTGSAILTVTVGSPTVGNDVFTLATNAPTTFLDVLANDRVLQSADEDWLVTAVTSTNPALGSMVVNGDQSGLEFTPSGQVGAQTYTYTLEDGTTPVRTLQGEVLVQVIASGIHANSDVYSVYTDSSATLLNVLTNDASLPDVGQVPTLVSIGTGVDAPDQGGSVSIDGATGQLLYAPSPGFIGEETFTYLMTDSENTDEATVVVRVSAGELVPNTDVFTVFFEQPGGTGTTATAFTLPVLDNDAVVPDFGQLLSITGVGLDATAATNAPTIAGVITINGDASSLIYTPQDEGATFPYVERFRYEISDGTARRAEAVVIVEVQQRADARDSETNDDAFSIDADSTSNLLPVLDNDNILPSSAADWTLTSVSTPDFGSALLSGPSVLYTPPTGFVGTATFDYNVSDGFGGTGAATVTIRVGDLPVVDDEYVVLSGTTSNLLDVLANDAIRPSTDNLSFDLFDALGADQGGAVTVVGAAVSYVPNAAYTGIYPYVESFVYQVQDDAGGLVEAAVAVQVIEDESNRDTGTVCMVVTGVNDPPTITPFTNLLTITDKQTTQPFQDVTIADVDEQGLEQQSVTVTIDDPIKGSLLNLGSFVETSPGTYTGTGTPAGVTAELRAMVYDPVENRVPVSGIETATFTLAVSDPYVVSPATDSSTEVIVSGANDPSIITGAVAGQTVYHKFSLAPFSSVTVTDIDDLTEQPLRIRVTLDDATHGVLTELGSFVDQGSGVYEADGLTPVQATAALRDLVFAPTTDGRIPPADSETTVCTITADVGFAAPTVDATDNANTTVIAKSGLVTKLLNNGSVGSEALGTAVSLSGDTLAVGAPFGQLNALQSGTVTLYGRDVGGADQWGEILTFSSDDAAAGDQFGYSVALDGDRLVVGAPLDQRDGSRPGSAYVFERNSGGTDLWGQTLKLSGFDGGNNDRFGFSVALDGNRIAAGAPFTSSGSFGAGTANSGGVYLFELDNPGFNPKVAASDAEGGAEFGYSVALGGNKLIVGVRLDDQSILNSGEVYSFLRSTSGPASWNQVQRFLGNDTALGDQLGTDVALLGDTLVAGAPQNDDPASASGSAYVFAPNPGAPQFWQETDELLADNGIADRGFGRSLALAVNRLVVGGPGSSSLEGSAQILGRPSVTGSWSTIEVLTPPEVDNFGAYGTDVTMSGYTVAVGAPGDDESSADSGAVYLYTLKFNNAPIAADPIPDQVANFSQVFDFVLPADSFVDPDVPDSLVLSAVIDSGTNPPPAWLTFDPGTGTFGGTPDELTPLTVTVTATDEDGATATSDFMIIVQVDPASSAKQLWRVANFGADTANPALESTVWGDDANPDMDSLTNLEEYLFGFDPDSPAPVVGPVFILPRAAGANPQVRYVRRTDDPSLVYTLQVATEADGMYGPATTLVLSESTAPIDASLEWVTATIDGGAANSTLFFHVLVTD